MRHTTKLMVPVGAVALIALGLAPANAAGQTERGPEHANSICSYSGLNDDPDDPVEGGRVQSYGQIVKHKLPDFRPRDIRNGIPSPGTLCNGHLFPYPEAFMNGE